MARTKNCGPNRPEPSSRGMNAISPPFRFYGDHKVLGHHFWSLECWCLLPMPKPSVNELGYSNLNHGHVFFLIYH